jgi:competence protein ComEC
VSAWIESRTVHLSAGALAAGLASSTVSDWVAYAVAGALLAVGMRGEAPRAALFLAAALALGVYVGTARLEALGEPAERLADGQRLRAEAEVLTPPRDGPFDRSAEVRIRSGIAAGARLLARFEAGRGADRLRMGAGVVLEGTFEPVNRSADFGDYLAARGVTGEIDVDRLRLGKPRGGWEGAVDAIRERGTSALAHGLDPEHAALARGMVLGDDSEVSPATKEDFRDAGLAHLLAASGSNVALLCGLAVPFLAVAGLPYGMRLLVLAGLIALYVPLAGGGPSIQRAGVMGAATLAAVALARPASRAYALGLAACVTLGLNPRACLDPGWQLSFAAVAGIILLAPAIARRLGALPRAVADGIALTVAAALATAPLVGHHFDTISLAGLPANVAAIALVAPIMWLGMVRVALGQMGVLDGLVATGAEAGVAAAGWALAPLLEALERLAGLFADMPGGQVDLSLDGVGAVMTAYVALGALAVEIRRAVRRQDTWVSTVVAYVRRLPRKHRAGLALTCAAAAALVLAEGLSPSGPPGELTVSFLDVGQGDATLIQHPDGGAVLFDGGPPEAAVARLLRRAGVRRLSALVMTHPSRDHHGGLEEVVERVPVDLLLDGGDGTHDPTFRRTVMTAVERGARVVPAVAPLLRRVGALRIDVLSPAPRPPGPPPDDPNPRAVVALVRSGGFELLLSADAESETLLSLPLPDVDAIKVPHHGSADLGLPDVLARLRPEIASIPVGSNAYGHPAPSTLDALEGAGVTTWRNDRNGTVRLTVADGQIRTDADSGEPVSAAP